MKYVIEKGIPMPPRASSRTPDYPLTELEIGDSFVIPLDGRTVAMVRQSVNKQAANRRASGHPKFSLATQPTPDGKGVRCWRVDNPKPVPVRKLGGTLAKVETTTFSSSTGKGAMSRLVSQDAHRRTVKGSRY